MPIAYVSLLPQQPYRAVPGRSDLQNRVRNEMSAATYCPLAAGVPAVVIAAAAVPVVVIAAAAAAGDQQDQDDDPPAVVAAKPIVTTHNRYLRILLSGLPLIPWYSGS